MKLNTLIISSIFLVIVSVLLNYLHLSENSQFWFQRSGSLLVILGAIFEGKYILRSLEEGKNVFNGSITIDSKKKVDDSVNIPFYKKSFNFKTHAGFYILIVGTVVWGYGDLPEKLIAFN